MGTFIVLILFVLRSSLVHPAADYTPDTLPYEDERMAGYLLAASEDIIQHTSLKAWRMDIMRQSYRGSAPYEIGFLVRATEERYRKMVDLYNTSITMDSQLRTRDHIMYLQKIEKLHWDITHLANMLHEVERKYKITPQVLDSRPDFTPWGQTNATTRATTTRHLTLTVKIQSCEVTKPCEQDNTFNCGSDSCELNSVKCNGQDVTPKFKIDKAEMEITFNSASFKDVESCVYIGEFDFSGTKLEKPVLVIDKITMDEETATLGNAFQHEIDIPDDGGKPYKVVKITVNDHKLETNKWSETGGKLTIDIQTVEQKHIGFYLVKFKSSTGATFTKTIIELTELV